MFFGKKSCRGKKVAVFALFLAAALLLGGCGINQTKKIDTQSGKTIIESTTKGKAEVEELFPVYGYDRDCIDKEINFYIPINSEYTLEEKLSAIADGLSRFRFSDLPIQVLSIKNDQNKKIAVVNLSEIDENKGITNPAEITGSASDTWIFGYFQGSAGGSATTETLVESFLQRKYTGEWIDGIEFLYENGPINMTHVEGLIGRIYR